jgi:predicted RNase H-like HicB family nuclease
MTAKRTYTARVERSGQWWAISVPSIRGVHSQTRRLDHAEHMARDAIAGVLDIDPSQVEVTLDIHLPTAIRTVVQAARQARSEAERATDRATDETRHAVTTLVLEQGLSVRDVGALLSLSHQRVSQLAGRH